MVVYNITFTNSTKKRTVKTKITVFGGEKSKSEYREMTIEHYRSRRATKVDKEVHQLV
jgi:hypothetical protein